MSFLLVAISRSRLCYCVEARHPSRPTAYTNVGEHIFFNKYHCFWSFYPQITIPLTLWCTKLGTPRWVKNSVRYSFGIEKYVDGIRYLDISPKYSGYGYISRCIVSSDIAWYGIRHHDISRYVMRYHTGLPRNTRQIQIQRKPTTSLRSTLVFSGFISALILACPPSGLFRRSSVVHQLDTS